VTRKLKEITDYLDWYLRHSEIRDYPQALNGLQVENSGAITRVVAAVDACQATIDLATTGDLMVVHHGLFWSGPQPIVGPHRQRIRSLISRDIALYSSHLPLDCHPDVGNNYLLARRLGVVNLEPFGEVEGNRIGVAGEIAVSRADLAAQLEAKLGAIPRVIGAGPDQVRRIGIVTGAGSGDLAAAAAAGLDTFLTGEGPHHTFLEAEELRINLIFAGHYATETLGVQALAAHLSEKYAVSWQFLDHPTGM
jgi:dinuclear metal center YbgI/SA1388 family protein